MQATRRTVLKGLAAGAAATAAGGVTAFPRRTAAAAAPLARPEGTTLDSTVVPGGEVVREGAVRPYRRLAAGPGEPHTVREELGARAEPGRVGRRAPLLSFAHFTDIHLIDAQSPARVEFLDRYDDDERFRTLFSSAYRPQEFLSPQLADSIVGAVRRQGVGPVTGAPLAFGLCTGDNTDNAQLNELQWHLDLMNGTPFTPNSGGAAFEGVHDQHAPSYDVHYWHPDGTPAGRQDDDLRRLFGFPTVPGLLDVAIAQFTPAGVGLPWYSCYGNHDGLVQGNFPESFNLTLAAEGPVKIVSLPATTSQADVVGALEGQDPGRLDQPFNAGAVRQVTPDANRRIISRTESVKEHFTRGGTPLGHGFTAENLQQGTAHYVFDVSPQVRGIVLDSVNPNGNSDGSLDAAQFAWLRARLEEVSGPGRDRLVIVFSHHGISTMTNRIVFVDDPQPRVLGPEVQALLLAFPNVVLMVDGHTHVNRVFARTRPGGGGFWEVSTAAHIDFPCQARLVELVDNRDGTLSIFGTVIDADAPLRAPDVLPASPTTTQLAALAREIAANDPQVKGEGGRGKVEDRNIELLVAAPFALSPAPAAAGMPGQQQPPAPAQPRSGPPATAGRSLPATGGGAALATGALGLAAVGAVLRRRAGADTLD